MSTPTLGTRAGETRADETAGATDRLVDPLRVLALGAMALLTAAYGVVFYDVTGVVGGTGQLTVIAAAALLAGVVLARVLRPAIAVVFGLVVFAGGLGTYLLSVPDGVLLLRSLDAVVTDVVALLTGLSILRITAAGAWVLGFAPAPIFLSWYFAIRERYVAAVAVGGGALAFFVLTGDASATSALLGAIAGAGAIGFGELARQDGGGGQAETLAIVLGAMVAVALLAPALPSGTADPILGEGPGGGSGAATIEAGLVNTGDELSILGSIELSPEVRFSVESDRSAYWRIGAYDRYTGDGWVRTGSDEPYSGSLAGPPGNTTNLTQQYSPATDLGVLPAAWKPTGVDGAGTNVRVSELGGLQPGGTIGTGDNYTVTSQRPQASADQLRGAGTDYPDAIADRGYTQVPEATPAWVGERTSVIARNANNPYDTARTIERWLENTKNYSLNVTRPDGSIAAGFLAEMDAGYCTYFATTMVTMLRTQDIPARFVTGYTSGQRVAEDRWVVRGLDSHAWVEAYFPEVGWVRFDPTPSGPREATESQRVDSAREDNASNVDTNASAEGEWTPPTVSEGNDTNVTGPRPGQVATPRRGAVLGGGGQLNGSNLSNATSSPPTAAPAPGGESGDGSGGSGWRFTMPSPTREELALGAVLLFGLGAAARRSGATARAYRTAWLRYRPDESPDAAIERSFARLEYLLAREHRERRPGETPREYLAAVGSDPRAGRVGDIHERARYAGRATENDAEEATRLVDTLVAERTPVLGRLRGRLQRGGDSI